MAWTIGIDLGTTNSCVAVRGEDGRIEVLATEAGERTTPSVVAWNASDEVSVGAAARRQQVSNVSGTIFGAKRLIGRKVNSDEVNRFAKVAPFRVVAAANGDAWVRVNDRAISPQEVASHILRRMRTIAEGALGTPITRAIVTVPAYFDEFQRQATRAAGAIAGLDIVRMLNEPTAAALAYGIHRRGEQRQHIAVFDLGGGTFDISVMAVEHGVFEVLATGGDTALGGEDWDAAIVERLCDEIFDQHRFDVYASPLALGRVREAVEAAKKALANEKSTALNLPFLGQNEAGATINIERTLRRAEVEEWTAGLTARLREPCEAALEEAGLSSDTIDEVLLVGGMTRWPAVQALVGEMFGEKVSRGANPDEIVAIGAATFASILDDEAADTALLDVMPHDVGIRVGEQQMSVLIPRNSMLPCRATKVFATTQDDQRFVAFELFQGNDPRADHNRKLARVQLDGLPAGKAGKVRVELAITVDVESIVSVSAKELSTGRETLVTIRPSGGLSHDEIVEIIARRRRQ